MTKTVDAGPEKGSGARGAQKGAAGGTIIANVAGGSDSKGAATGAVMGGIAGRRGPENKRQYRNRCRLLIRPRTRNTTRRGKPVWLERAIPSSNGDIGEPVQENARVTLGVVVAT